MKYFNEDIKGAYKAIEVHAIEKILSFLPDDLRPEYNSILMESEDEKEHWQLVKAADTLCAYIKCLEEMAAGNREFNRAKVGLENTLREMKMPEVDYFLKNFIHSFSLSLDELSV